MLCGLSDPLSRSSVDESWFNESQMNLTVVCGGGIRLWGCFSKISFLKYCFVITIYPLITNLSGPSRIYILYIAKERTKSCQWREMTLMFQLIGAFRTILSLGKAPSKSKVLEGMVGGAWCERT